MRDFVVITNPKLSKEYVFNVNELSKCLIRGSYEFEEGEIYEIEGFNLDCILTMDKKLFNSFKKNISYNFHLLDFKVDLYGKKVYTNLNIKPNTLYYLKKYNKFLMGEDIKLYDTFLYLDNKLVNYAMSDLFFFDNYEKLIDFKDGTIYSTKDNKLIAISKDEQANYLNKTLLKDFKESFNNDEDMDLVANIIDHLNEPIYKVYEIESKNLKGLLLNECLFDNMFSVNENSWFMTTNKKWNSKSLKYKVYNLVQINDSKNLFFDIEAKEYKIVKYNKGKFPRFFKKD